MSSNTYSPRGDTQNALFVPQDKRGVLCLACGNIGLVDRARVHRDTRFKCNRCGDVSTLAKPKTNRPKVPPRVVPPEPDERRVSSPAQLDFWTYMAEHPAPPLVAVPPGALAPGTSYKEWDQLSPGMRREIVRTYEKTRNKKPRET